MTELFICPHCKARTLIEEELRGQSGPCFQCGKRITIPGGEASFMGTGLLSSQPADLPEPSNKRTTTGNLLVGGFWGGLLGLALAMLLHVMPSLFFNLRAFGITLLTLQSFLQAVYRQTIQLTMTGLVGGAVLFAVLGAVARHPAATALSFRRAISGALLGMVAGTAAGLVRQAYITGILVTPLFLQSETLTSWAGLVALAGASILGLLTAFFARWQIRQLKRLAPEAPHPLDEPAGPEASSDSPPAGSASPTAGPDSPDALRSSEDSPFRG